MNIYAAIDLRNGKCVRLTQGDPNKETIYSESPVETATQWVEAGTDWLHVVNLDGAFGNPSLSAKNNEAVQSILEQVNVPVQFGGGLRNPADVEQALAIGVSRVVIGSMAVTRPELMLDILTEFGSERIALGLDVRDGKIATNGWRNLSDTDPATLVQTFQEAGLKYIIHTDISRDGMLSGANVAASVALAQRTQTNNDHEPLNVIVSGGVAGLEDVRQVKAVEEKGLEGLIIGKALYTGAIDLAEAMAIARPETHNASGV